MKCTGDSCLTPFQRELVNKIKSDLFLKNVFSPGIDRVLYSQTLEVIERPDHIAKFVSPEGNRLSEHNPRVVRFKMKR